MRGPTAEMTGTMESIKTMIEEVMDDIGEPFSTHLDEIPHEAYDGFIPFTNGGYDGVLVFGLHGSYEESNGTALIAKHLDNDYKMMQAEFRREKELDDEVELDETVEGWEQFRDKWEQNDEGGTWFVKVRAILFFPDNHRNETGEAEILFCIGINDDFEYGRDSISWARGTGTTWVWEETVKVVDINETKLEEIKVAMLAAWVAS